MTPFAVTARYRYGEDGESRDACFYGLLFDRSEGAVLGRLKEAHRFAAWIEVVELRWRGGDGAAARDRRQDCRQYFVPGRQRRGDAPLGARDGRSCGPGIGP